MKLPRPGTKWRRHLHRASVAVLRDSLNEAGLWPVSVLLGRVAAPDEFSVLEFYGPNGRVQIIAHPFAPDGGFTIANLSADEWRAPVTIVSPRDWARINMEMANARTYDASYAGRVQRAQAFMDSDFITTPDWTR